MVTRLPLTRLLAALGLSLGALLPPAHALDFVFTDVSAGGPMSAAQLAAFQTAADYWKSKLSDPVTVYISIGFSDLGPSILGSTNSNLTSLSYSSLRTRLTSDATSALDATAVSHMQAGPALSFMATQGDLSSRLDNDGSANNTQIGITTANAKAIGIGIPTNAASPDARIIFANAYAGDFVYSRAGGVPTNKVDFITVAEHEIGHALGFVSGVDDIDYCVDHAAACHLSGAANEFETAWWLYPLDIFRYSAAGQLDFRVGGSPYFSVDGGATSIESFSTGVTHGNGWQASHFGTGVITLMRPFVGDGESYDATASDLAAFDVMGWNVSSVVAVPEPASYALLLSGIAVVGFVARRRRQR